MDITHSKIGIWGFGLVGKSALSFLTKQSIPCQIFDNRPLSKEEQETINRYHATHATSFDTFIKENDLILASPGIDIAPYKDQANFICELDIFCHFWKKPIIAITGTVGKTSVTTLLGELLKTSMPVAVGGNIGTPMLDLVAKQNHIDYAILELSSWQLEYAHTFKPDIAIWTNFFPNHLDRHKTIGAYFQAKAQLILHQLSHQIAILPKELQEACASLNIQSHIIWIDAHAPLPIPVPNCTFKQNWHIILEVLKFLNLPLSLIENSSITIEHRMEFLGTVKDRHFYNDSKSTTPASTRAALERCTNTPVMLILGGLSKGVDRSSFIQSLPSNVKKIICFGKEAEQLDIWCKKYDRSSIRCVNLETALNECLKESSPSDTILFSPAGSSFDLYKNYEKRGEHFKQLVRNFAANP